MPQPGALLKGFAKTIANLEPNPRKRLIVGDPDTRGLFVRITPAGVKTYTVVARNPAGRQVWAAIGLCSEVTLEDARAQARSAVTRIKAGTSPFPPSVPVRLEQTFKEVSDAFVRIHVRKEGQKGERPLHSAREIERIVIKYLLPRLGKIEIGAISRSEVANLLDKISTENGPAMADAALAQMSKIFNWHASRDDQFVSPLVRGMKRTKPRARARIRVLSDDEIRSFWSAASALGTFGAFVKVALLTGQRREKVSKMRWADIDENGIWTVDELSGQKGTIGRVKLSPMALEVVQSLPMIDGNKFVFAGRGTKAIAGFSACKAKLDDKMGEVAPWRLHDLRRTAKTLMRRARIDRDISERVLGHVIPGVEGVYDRHGYFDEMSEALATLDRLVGEILNPPPKGGIPAIKAA